MMDELFLPVFPPVRVCCGQRHSGPVCPDGRVMCAICFEKFNQDQLAVDSKDGKLRNICRECDKREMLF